MKEAKNSIVVIFNNEFVEGELKKALVDTIEKENISYIHKFLTDEGQEAVLEYMDIIKKYPPTRLGIRHFFNCYIFNPLDKGLKQETTNTRGLADHRFRGENWVKEEYENVYQIFNIKTAPIILDIERFEEVMHYSSELLFPSNLKSCLAAMIRSEEIRRNNKQTEIEELKNKEWTAHDIAIIQSTLGISEKRIAENLEKYTHHKPVVFKKNINNTYNILWDNLILRANEKSF